MSILSRPIIGLRIGERLQAPEPPAPSCSANLTGDEVGTFGFTPMETIQSDYAETIDPGEQRAVSTPRFVVDWSGTRSISFDLTADDPPFAYLFEIVNGSPSPLSSGQSADGQTVTFTIDGDTGDCALLRDGVEATTGTISDLSNECMIMLANDDADFGSMTVTANAGQDQEHGVDQDWCGNDFPSAPSANLTGDVATDLGITPFETINDDSANTESTSLRLVSTPRVEVPSQTRELEIEIVDAIQESIISVSEFDSDGNQSGQTAVISSEFGQGDRVNVEVGSNSVQLYVNGNAITDSQGSGTIGGSAVTLSVFIQNGGFGGTSGPMEIQTYAALADQQFNQSGNGW